MSKQEQKIEKDTEQEIMRSLEVINNSIDQLNELRGKLNSVDMSENDRWIDLIDTGVHLEVAVKRAKKITE